MPRKRPWSAWQRVRVPQGTFCLPSWPHAPGKPAGGCVCHARGQGPRICGSASGACTCPAGREALEPRGAAQVREPDGGAVTASTPHVAVLTRLAAGFSSRVRKEGPARSLRCSLLCADPAPSRSGSQGIRSTWAREPFGHMFSSLSRRVLTRRAMRRLPVADGRLVWGRRAASWGPGLRSAPCGFPGESSWGV